jgi:hypothetical protein
LEYVNGSKMPFFAAVPWKGSDYRLGYVLLRRLMAAYKVRNGVSVHVSIQKIILPRQAWDKDSENSQKGGRFLTGSAAR